MKQALSRHQGSSMNQLNNKVLLLSKTARTVPSTLNTHPLSSTPQRNLSLFNNTASHTQTLTKTMYAIKKEISLLSADKKRELSLSIQQRSMSKNTGIHNYDRDFEDHEYDPLDDIINNALEKATTTSVDADYFSLYELSEESAYHNPDPEDDLLDSLFGDTPYNMSTQMENMDTNPFGESDDTPLSYDSYATAPFQYKSQLRHHQSMRDIIEEVTNSNSTTTKYTDKDNLHSYTLTVSKKITLLCHLYDRVSFMLSRFAAGEAIPNHPEIIFRRESLADQGIKEVVDVAVSKLETTFSKSIVDIATELPNEINTVLQQTVIDVIVTAAVERNKYCEGIEWSSEILDRYDLHQIESIWILYNRLNPLDELPSARAFEQQLLAERCAVEAAATQYLKLSHELVDLNKAAVMRPLQRFIVGWFGPLVRILEHEFERIRTDKAAARAAHAKYMTLLTPPDLACIVIHEILGNIVRQKGTSRYSDIAYAIGRALNSEVLFRRLREDRYKFKRALDLSPNSSPSQLIRKARQLKIENSVWDESVRFNIGSLLTYYFINIADVQVANASKSENDAISSFIDSKSKTSQYNAHAASLLSSLDDKVTSSNPLANISPIKENDLDDLMRAKYGEGNTVRTKMKNVDLPEEEEDVDVGDADMENLDDNFEEKKTHLTRADLLAELHTKIIEYVDNAAKKNDESYTVTIFRLLQDMEVLSKLKTTQMKTLLRIITGADVTFSDYNKQMALFREILRREYAGTDLVGLQAQHNLTTASQLDADSFNALLDYISVTPGIHNAEHLSNPYVRVELLSGLSAHSLSKVRKVVDPNTGVVRYSDTLGLIQFNDDLLPPKTNAFMHSLILPDHAKKGRVGMISCHRELWDTITNDVFSQRGLSPKLIPMTTVPVPWKSRKFGGYISVRHDVARVNHSDRQSIHNLDVHDLSYVYSSLDKIGQIAWRINDKILSAIDVLIERGRGECGLPAAVNIQIPEPEELPENVTFDKNSPSYHEPDMEEARKRYLRLYFKNRATTRQVFNANANLHSSRCDMSLKIVQAHECAGKPIYFPYNMDFRGRAYPLPPHLNHLGADPVRGLLQFDKGKALGERGLYWLYAHLSAQFGVDKVSFDDRVAFAKSKWDLIEKTALNPHAGAVPNPRLSHVHQVTDPLVDIDEFIPWWHTADNPFQALATIFEIYEAESSGDPSNFISHLPVHQDGSCNGLQHYAALGRDKLGGSRVNLLPAEKPQDVYSHVLAQAKIQLAVDAEQGNELAALLLPLVSRKVVKQTVMTSVYGVTIIGAREQIQKQLKDLDFVWPDEQMLQAASLYLAKQTLSSLSAVFVGAKEIMNYLTECAKVLAEHQHPVSWISPIGLPITQPYREESKYTVATHMQTLQLTFKSHALPISSRRQKGAFPPNFVHSLDASHMMFTANKCIDAGINFAAVHDSYWTNAADVDQMNVLLREAFIELYNRPILEEFHDSLLKRFPGVELPPIPERGDLDLEEIKNSKYFFS